MTNEKTEHLRISRRGDTWETVRKLTAREEAAILNLEKVLEGWPETLEFHSGTGGLNVLLLHPKTRANYSKKSGVGYRQTECLDPDSIAAQFDVKAQGGDPW